MNKLIKMIMACILSLGFSSMAFAGLDEIPSDITDSSIQHGFDGSYAASG